MNSCHFKKIQSWNFPGKIRKEKPIFCWTCWTRVCKQEVSAGHFFPPQVNALALIKWKKYITEAILPNGVQNLTIAKPLMHLNRINKCFPFFLKQFWFDLRIFFGLLFLYLSFTIRRFLSNVTPLWRPRVQFRGKLHLGNGINQIVYVLFSLQFGFLTIHSNKMELKEFIRFCKGSSISWNEHFNSSLQGLTG